MNDHVLYLQLVDCGSQTMNGRTWTLLLAAAVLSGCRSAQFNLFCGHPGEHEFARVELPDVVRFTSVTLYANSIDGLRSAKCF